MKVINRLYFFARVIGYWTLGFLALWLLLVSILVISDPGKIPASGQFAAWIAIILVLIFAFVPAKSIFKWFPEPIYYLARDVFDFVYASIGFLISISFIAYCISMLLERASKSDWFWFFAMLIIYPATGYAIWNWLKDHTAVPKMGDRIAILTPKFIKHYGIFSSAKYDEKNMDNNKVIHFNGGLQAEICEVTLKEFSNDRIRHVYVASNTSKTGKREPSRSPEEIVETARYYLAKKGEPNKFGDYDMTTNNCEHFANFCRGFERKSIQSNIVFDSLGRLLFKAAFNALGIRL